MFLRNPLISLYLRLPWSDRTHLCCYGYRSADLGSDVIYVMLFCVQLLIVSEIESIRANAVQISGVRRAIPSFPHPQHIDLEFWINTSVNQERAASAPLVKVSFNVIRWHLKASAIADERSDMTGFAREFLRIQP